MSNTASTLPPQAATRSTNSTDYPVDPSRFLRNRDILCFSHDWTGDPLSKTHLMRLLACDNRVLWVNSIGYRAPTVSKADLSRAFKKVKAVFNRIKEVEHNIFVLNPLALPWQNRLAKAVNRKLLAFQVRSAMRKLSFERVINWIFNPAAAIMARAFSEDLLIYHCVDEYTAFSGVASESLARMETDLLKQSDIVIVSAEKLLESKAAVNPKTVMVRHGVDFEHFRRALDPKLRVPPEVANLPKPVIGFYGLIADWVNVDLMAKVARHFGNGSLVVLGKATTDVSELSSIPNVHMLGRKPYAELPAYCKAFDVALNPFRINRLTLNANPLKVREYMAAGLPVVATAIPEVECLGGCRIGHDDAEFISQIEEALKSSGPGTERSEAVRRESWAARLDEIRGHLASFGLALPPEEAV